MDNPYPEFLEDEHFKIPDLRHQIWDEGYKAGTEDAAKRIQAKLDKWRIEC